MMVSAPWTLLSPTGVLYYVRDEVNLRTPADTSEPTSAASGVIGNRQAAGGYDRGGPGGVRRRGC
jgi:hypothetical protein